MKKNSDKQTLFISMNRQQLENLSFLTDHKSRIAQVGLPLVISGERYYGRGIERKLDVSAHFVRECERHKLLLRKNGKKPAEGERIPYETDSIAELISLQWMTTVEQILLPSNYAKTPEFSTLKDKEKLARLFNAYTGVGWFDCFFKAQEKNARLRKERKARYPIVREWHLIPRSEIGSWTGTDTELSEKLYSAGFIRPANRQPVECWPEKNYIDNKFLALFLSYLHKSNDVELFLPKKDDDFYHKLIEESIPQALTRAMQKDFINPLDSYEVSEAAARIERSWQRVYDNVKRGTLPSRKNNGELRVMGIDLAIWKAKEAWKLSMSLNEIARLFGIKIEEISLLGLPVTRSGKKGTQRTVLPLYSTLVKKVRSSNRLAR